MHATVGISFMDDTDLSQILIHHPKLGALVMSLSCTVLWWCWYAIPVESAVFGRCRVGGLNGVGFFFNWGISVVLWGLDVLVWSRCSTSKGLLIYFSSSLHWNLSVSLLWNSRSKGGDGDGGRWTVDICCFQLEWPFQMKSVINKFLFQHVALEARVWGVVEQTVKGKGKLAGESCLVLCSWACLHYVWGVWGKQGLEFLLNWEIHSNGEAF